MHKHTVEALERAVGLALIVGSIGAAALVALVALALVVR